jgi:hypothetical protein
MTAARIFTRATSSPSLGRNLRARLRSHWHESRSAMNGKARELPGTLRHFAWRFAISC